MLNNLPPIFCLTDSLEKREHMKNQFDFYNISNYKFIEKKYKIEKFEEWRNDIEDEKIYTTEYELSKALNLIRTIVDWYDGNDSETCIIMEDNVDLTTSQNWIFDWDYLINNLPYNWDCIKFYHSRLSSVKMHLHPFEIEKSKKSLDYYNTSSNCFMITRYFAKKVKHYHTKGSKFLLHYNNRNKRIKEVQYGSTSEFLFDIGLTYVLPIFSLNPEYIPSDSEHLVNKLASEAISYWWKQRSKLHTKFQFFNYNKDNEWKMEAMYDIRTTEVYRDENEKLMIWI